MVSFSNRTITISPSILLGQCLILSPEFVTQLITKTNVSKKAKILRPWELRRLMLALIENKIQQCTQFNLSCHFYGLNQRLLRDSRYVILGKSLWHFLYYRKLWNAQGWVEPMLMTLTGSNWSLLPRHTSITKSISVNVV